MALMHKMTQDEQERFAAAKVHVSTESVTGRKGSSASSLALHEASHAVVAAYFSGLPSVKSVHIKPFMTEDGVAFGETTLDWKHYDVSKIYDREVALDFAQYYYAPAFTCGRFGCGPDIIGLDDDGQRIYDIAANVFGITDPASAQFNEWSADLVTRTMKTSVPLLPLIALLAEKLDSKEEISGEDVRRIVGVT